ncbi:RNA 2',3'-cyclic phosphodiesterase [Candidatus Pacearchaeota archaeon]|nr:RNA 2',3'-cyclic phosphodiesterase [Candidatus Pacearchaeota archaeon]
MRVFISIDIPEKLKKEIALLQKQIYSQGFFEGKITEPENLHLTLKFIGEITDSQLIQIKERLKKVKLKQFKARLGSLGVFTNDLIKIIWIKMEGDGIFELQNKIDSCLSDIFKKEKRFMSHLTIARVKKVKNKPELLNLLGYEMNKEFPVAEFNLKNSELTPTKPIYTILEKYKLES